MEPSTQNLAGGGFPYFTGTTTLSRRFPSLAQATLHRGLVLDEDGRLVGFISITDIVRLLSASGR